MNSSVVFSSKTAEWATPQALFDELAAEFPFTLDAAATHENAKCHQYLTRVDNALAWDWRVLAQEHGDIPWGAVWLNPPYGRELQQWIKKAADTAFCGVTVVCLLPARVDTKWWHAHIWDAENHAPRPGVEVRFLKGRVKFGGSDTGAPFPSAVVVFKGVPQ